MPQHHRPVPPSPIPAPTPIVVQTPALPRLRGVNICGMEGRFDDFPAASGPVAGTNYPVHSTKLIDYYKSKGVTVLRFLFSWERMVNALNGNMPSTGAGYTVYFANYKRIVDYATGLGINVIVEPWQCGMNGDTGGATWRGQQLGTVIDLYAFADFWGRMASIFAGNPHVLYGLVNEPNNMSTMTWFTIAQKCIDYIRRAGAKTPILVPGNGWTSAGSWTDTWYDTASPKRSNAYGWLNANGPGVPLYDPLNNLLAEVHLYADANAGGGSTDIASQTILADRLAKAVLEARAHKYKLFIGEVGFYEGATFASQCWKSFHDFVETNADVIAGYAWWAAGAPGWWDDVGAHGGGHFSVTPTNATAFTGDTVNMTMIAPGF